MNNASQIDEFCKERGFIGWFETSAKENINIDESARFLVTQVNKCRENSVMCCLCPEGLSRASPVLLMRIFN